MKIARSIALGFTATAVAATAVVTAPQASADSSGNCWAQDLHTPVVKQVTTTDGRAQLEMRYWDYDQCTEGLVTGPVGSELWLDRRYPYQGFLGYTTIAPGYGYAGTGSYNDSGLQIRVCGTSGKGNAISCTDWY